MGNRVGRTVCPKCGAMLEVLDAHFPPADASPWPGYPRRVAIGPDAVLEIALIELRPGAFALVVESDHDTVTVELAGATDGGWRVDDAALARALEATAQLAVRACHMPRTHRGRVLLASVQAELDRTMTALEARQVDLSRLRAETAARGARLEAHAADALEAAGAIGAATMHAGVGDLVGLGEELARALAAVARIGGGS